MTVLEPLLAPETWVLAPLAVLMAGAFIVYLVARLVTARNTWLALITAGVLAVAGVALSVLAGQVVAAERQGSAPPAWLPAGGQGAGLSADTGALFMAGLGITLGLCVAVYSGRYLALDRRYRIYYPLLLMLVAGLVGTVMAADLFGIYLFSELMGVTAYALVAFRRRTDTAIEAGFKYLIMGSAGTLTFLMGLSLFYRETGSVALVQPLAAPGVWARMGLAGMLAGLAIKSAVVPAHTWLPDAHGRAPSSVSAMLSGIVIETTFFALLKVALGVGYPPAALGLLLMLLGILNMTVGNVLALVQDNTKRLLAYSTLAQMGYAMFAVGVGLRYNLAAAVQAGFFLILAHAAMKGLAFLSKGVCHFYCGTTRVAELRGTFRQLPLVAVTLTVALTGLAGIPPLAGFAAKWRLMAELLRAGDPLVVGGLVIFLLNSVLSIAYYLPLIAMLFAPRPAAEVAAAAPVLPGTPVTAGAAPTAVGATPTAVGAATAAVGAAPVGERIRISPWMALPLIALTLLVIALGLSPGLGLHWAQMVLR